MKQIATIATGLIVLRQLVAALHGMAHQHLGVGLSASQQTFVIIVITIVPLVSLVLYWTRFVRAAALLLWTSMLAGMLFGVYYHFIEISPDNVRHLPEGDSQGFFTATAVLLVPVEMLNIAFGWWSWRKLGRSAESAPL